MYTYRLPCLDGGSRLLYILNNVVVPGTTCSLMLCLYFDVHVDINFISFYSCFYNVHLYLSFIATFNKLPIFVLFID